MDSLTHIALGACMGEAFAGKTVGRKAMLWGALAQSIPDVDFVVNYDLPDVPENYVHRVGRTGRGQAKGFAVSFCSMEEKEVLEEIESFLEKEITIMEIGNKAYTETLNITEDTSNNNWKALLKEAEQDEKNAQAKKRKKKK